MQAPTTHTASSPNFSSITLAHQSVAPWLSTLAAGDVQRLAGTSARRWLLVQHGSLWVTAAAGAANPTAREADIWLAEGESLSLPPGSSWLLQAWPQAELMLVEHAPAWLPRAAPQRPTGLRQLLRSSTARLRCAWSRLQPASLSWGWPAAAAAAATAPTAPTATTPATAASAPATPATAQPDLPLLQFVTWRWRAGRRQATLLPRSQVEDRVSAARGPRC